MARAVSLERAGLWEEAAAAFDELFETAALHADPRHFVDSARGRACALRCFESRGAHADAGRVRRLLFDADAEPASS